MFVAPRYIKEFDQRSDTRRSRSQGSAEQWFIPYKHFARHGAQLLLAGPSGTLNARCVHRFHF
jgi:hypothetical protein